MSESSAEPPGGADSWSDIGEMAEVAESNPESFQAHVDAVDDVNRERREEAGGGLSGWEEH